MAANRVDPSERDRDREGITAASVREALERIQDPCSAASGAPAGLVSMGLVRDVQVTGPPGAARVDVKLCITEPGCFMGAVFKTTAQRDLAELPGVASVRVEVDHGYIWDPNDMTAAYRKRLDRARAARVERMKRQMAASEEGLPQSGTAGDAPPPGR